MKSSKQHTPKKQFGLLLIGPPKAGKTSLALAFPKPAILDCDNNLTGPMRRAGNVDFFFENPNWDDKTSAEVPYDQRWQRSCDFMKEAIASKEVETIVVDGLSALAQYLQDHIIKAAGSDASKLKIAGVPVMQQSFWTPFRNWMAQFIMAARSCGKHFIVTCHETALQNENGGVVGYRPLISGQLQHNIAGFFSDVWRMEAQDKMGKPRYMLRVQPRNLHQIGNSLGIKEPELDLTDKTPALIWEMLKPYLS
jgi:hypothetical protein